MTPLFSCYNVQCPMNKFLYLFLFMCITSFSPQLVPFNVSSIQLYVYHLRRNYNFLNRLSSRIAVIWVSIHKIFGTPLSSLWFTFDWLSFTLLIIIIILIFPLLFLLLLFQLWFCFCLFFLSFIYIRINPFRSHSQNYDRCTKFWYSCLDYCCCRCHGEFSNSFIRNLHCSV